VLNIHQGFAQQNSIKSASFAGIFCDDAA